MQYHVRSKPQGKLLGLLMLLLVLTVAILGPRVQAIHPWGAYVQGFALMFLSILLEALPFVLLGTFISAMIHLFLSESMVARLLPRNQFLGLLAASLMGFVFPVCECAIVPIMRGLIKKGVPVGMAVTFLLAVPIVNPVVLASTYYAFAGEWGPVILRALGGIIIAVFVGDLMGRLHAHGSPLKHERFYDQKADHHGHGHSHDHDCGCGHDHGHGHEHAHGKRPGLHQTLLGLLEHTSEELFDIGRYLIAGAALSALLQTLVPREFLLTVGGGKLSSIIVMMLLAYILSLCSEADAFIARTFVRQFTNGSVLAFLVFGPMIDLKNTLLLMGAFERRFVVRLIAATSGAVIVFALLVNAFGM